MTGDRSILVVDDDPDARGIVVRLLREAGFPVWEGDGAVEAVELMQRHQPALVLLDAGLPGGGAAARRLKEDPTLRDVFVVLLSAAGSRPPEPTGDPLTVELADGYITQPFDPWEFLVWIESFLRIQASQQALRRSEMLLATGARLARLGSWEWNIESGLLVPSDEWRRIHGCSAPTLSMVELLNIAHPDDLPAILRAFERVREAGEPYDLEHRIVRQNDGAVRFVAVYGEVTRNEAGRPLQMLGATQDLTERKLAAIERAALHRQLLKVSRQAGMAEVATGVLHNAGNVLNSINVAVAMLSDRLRALRTPKLTLALRSLRELAAPVPDKLPRLLDYLDSLATHFSEEQRHLLQELRAVTEHIDHVKQIINRQQVHALNVGIDEPVALALLLDDALTINISRRYAIQIQREYELLPPIITDKHKLLQIVVNLVRNARDALVAWSPLPSGALRQLTVRLRRADQRVRLEVSDNGVGIAPEFLARVFEFGFTDKPDGHGFGLHTSANLARELGGNLHCHSAGPGWGATFILELPFTPAGSSNEPHDVRRNQPTSARHR